MSRVLVARLDNVGDVLLAGPAVRAVASKADRLTFLAGSSGASAAQLLPGVDDVWVYDAPWIGLDAAPVDRRTNDALIDRVGAARIDAAVILTSFHQSPLPLALLLRSAGVGHVAATSVDHPGSLLDVRYAYRPELHEVEQALATCEAAGFPLAAGDDERLAVDIPASRVRVPDRPYVVIHPGASVPARRLPVAATASAAGRLANEGWHIVTTGGANEHKLTSAVSAQVPADQLHDRTGRTDLAGLAHLLAGADVVICANTGPAHLAAAVGTPVVEAFAPVVPANRWRPWGVPHVLLGDHSIACAGCRARTCPIEGQPCLDPFRPGAVVDAVRQLTGRPAAATVPPITLTAEALS